MRLTSMLSAALFASLPAVATAGTVLGDGRIAEETVVAIWDGGREEVFVGAAADALGDGARFAVTLPENAELAPIAQGETAVFASFFRLARLPSPDAEPEFALGTLVHREGDACKAVGGGCTPAVRTWIESAWSTHRTLATAPFPMPEDGGAARPIALHARFATKAAFVPFSDPDDPSAAGATIAADDAHPPRMRIWVELGVETKRGDWEKRMDAAAEALRNDLARCALAEGRGKKLAGDVHVQVRIAPGEKPEVQGERASSKPFEKVAACFSPVVEKAEWPRFPEARAIVFEVHALLRPPVAAERRFTAVLLLPRDAEPHLGSEDDPRVPPDTTVLVSYEPSPAELRGALSDELRAALGVALDRRWRVVALRSGADPHGTEDVVMRPLAELAPPQPGEKALPIVERGDRPFVAPAGREKLWHRRGVRLAALAALIAALVAAALLLDRDR